MIQPMKLRFVCLFFIFSLAASGVATNSGSMERPVKPKKYHALVITTNQNKVRGVLLKTDSLGITLEKMRQRIYIPRTDIWELRFRRKGSGGKIFAGGVIVGVALGVVVANSQKTEPDTLGEAFAPDLSAAAGVGIGILSSGIGLLVSQISYGHKFFIRGNPVSYKNYYKDIEAFSFEREIVQLPTAGD